MSRFYDIDGTPITEVLEWAKVYEKRLDDGSARIGRTRLDDGTLVSTVWLGIDHRMSRVESDPPILFETMILCNEEHDGRQWRWSTKQEAEAGHQNIVERLEGGQRL